MAGMTTRVVVWLTEGTWEAAVDATAATLHSDIRPAIATEMQGSDVALLYVVDSQISDAVHGAFGVLLGRAARRRDPGVQVEQMAHQASTELLQAAQRRLGRPASLVVRTGRVEREVVDACAGADLLICARDGDHTRLGPHSLGRHTRFVIDHAPCAVLLIWPDAVPGLESIPPPPEHPA
jgi:nucleotide-binding universal stress UspA family protein